MTETATPSLICPTCGASAVAGDRFCEACGADLPFDVAVEPPKTTDGAPCVSCGAAAADIQDGYCGICGMKQPAPRDHIEVEHDSVAAVTDKGRKHHRNEDAFALGTDDRGRVLAVVCDGVSTTINPDLASQAAVDAAIAALSTASGDSSETGDAPLRLVAAFDAARAAVLAVEGAPQPPDLGWPSCTFLASVVENNVVDIATLGDCRTFWLADDGGAEVLTEDDSWAADQIAQGLLTADEAYADPMAHSITRWIGHDADASWRPRLVQFTASHPGRLVLCSDGLWNYTPAGSDVVAAAANTATPLAAAQQLVNFANDHGGHDNITVVVIPIGSKGSSR